MDITGNYTHCTICASGLYIDQLDDNLKIKNNNKILYFCSYLHKNTWLKNHNKFKPPLWGNVTQVS